MTAFAWMRARPRAVASASVLSASAVVITSLAFAYEGLPTTEVDLHDGGVWVTKQSSLLIGHFNHQSQVLDGGLRTSADEYDILQSGDDVIMVDQAASAITTIDPAMVTLTDSSNVPAGAKVALGGPTIAVLDSASGALWVAPVDSVGALEVAGEEPTVELGPDSDVTVGLDGTVYAVSPENAEIITVPVDAEGEAEEPSRAGIEELADSDTLTITAVGDTAVVLDAASGSVITSRGLRAEIGASDDAVLQYASAQSDAALVATSDALVRVPFDGSDPVEIPAGANGIPAAPVSLLGCAYGAWSASAMFIRDCVGTDDDLTAPISGADETAQLKFRVNRDVIVLNDIIGGTAWMASDDLQEVDNWNDITPPEGEAEENDEDTAEETVETTLPERSEKNTVPIAVDDTFGVRPGRSTVLPVLDNDTDADGDVLTVTLPEGGPSLGDVQSINAGSGLQIAVPENAAGTASFEYEVDDGRGGTASATVALTVRGWETNSAPKQKRITSLIVESGGVVDYNVLPDWIDPDGDDVFLRSVVPAEGDEVDFTADGRITYRALGLTNGRKDVEITVSDGDKATQGIVRIDVRPAGSTDPVTNADHIQARVGQTVTVSPLANDTSGSTEPLRLARVDEIDGARVRADFGANRFSFVSDSAGVYYVQYLAAVGSRMAPGIVRIDVTEPELTELPPVAVRDVALLPSGGEVLVNALANDTDPSGGVLVIQSVSVNRDSGVSVSVLGHETLRISDTAALTEQIVIGYTISNGRDSADGEVVVIPVPPPSKLRPPVANDDEVVVRVGDVVTIPVLDNDYHPNNDRMTVAPDLVEPLPSADEGEIFVSQNTVRFRAGTEPGTTYATYEVVDSAGQKDAGYITIQVLPRSDETNQAPKPRDITARVLTGAQTRIPVTLDGIDPDGDSVELVGIASAPTKGRVIEVGANSLTYEAVGDAVGEDVFTYRVRDNLGQEATAAVRVGIAPSLAFNQAPYAVKDSVVMRPGRSVAVPVVANDSDPEGDRLTLLSDGLILPENSELDAEVLGDRVIVTAPAEEGNTSLQYTIRDERGAEAIAVLQITVDEDVPLLRPIARDDRVLVDEISEENTVDLEVLANDEDPDGTIDGLEVSLSGVETGARVLSDGMVRITLEDRPRLLTYTITDQDGLTASAFIGVPSLEGLPPTLISTEPLEVKSGETVEIPLTDHVRTSTGKKLVITEAAKVSAVHGNGDALVKDQTTLVYTSADRYFGQDALTFEVTDGTGPDDPEGIKATLTLPITVLPPDNQPPTFTNGAISVAPGEEAASLDLRALTADIDEGDLDSMSYTLVGGSPDGMSASIDGQTLLVSADVATPKGTQATLALSITDGETDPIAGDVVVTVTASTKPLATAVDDVVAEAHQGVPVSVPVLRNDVSPFPGEPLTLVSALPETAGGLAEVTGDEVLVSPEPDFVGTLVVRYRVQDATADPDREVEGRITLTVLGRPDIPGTPTVSSVQDRTVVLSWTPPADNGAEITGYTVSAVAQDYTKECAATTCTLDGLTNNVEYNFTVIAHNRVGDSDASAPSATARPDARPDTPAPPTLKFGDRSLQVAWVTPTTPGSPVESFTLEISPAPPSGIAQKTKVTGNSLVWDGLENGTNYQVRVRAHNRAPDPSSWSPWSASEVPARQPDAPAAPSVARLEPVGSQAQLEVAWTQPTTNGADIEGYELQVRQGSSVVRTITGIPAGQRTQAISVGTSTTDYTFRVRASNKAGWSEWGATSSPRRAFGEPGAPSNVSAVPGDRRLTVSYSAASGNGATASELRYEYSLSGGGWNALPSNNVITGLTNGTNYTVRLRAYTALDGVRYNGPASTASAAQKPYGPVGTPGASASRSGRDITFSWSAPAQNGRAIDQVQIRIDGGGWQNVANNGSRTNTYAYSTTHKIEVRAYDTEGQVSNVRSASATTVAAPPPPQARAWTTKGTRTNSATCTTTLCHKMVLHTENFPAGNYRVRCAHYATPGGFSTYNNVYISGSFTREFGCHFGGAAGTQAWFIIDGWGTSERATW
ncbi:Ig-like domain-containing protein [Microbacterium sp. C7(2022)]|uniref:Ig-like domain-containing protein n=1 Tax=Microbacterium sp. C7(2022) TaxID=2992759 RepID=UPI00237BD2E4|nr:Ig-like domain-containing protein [Microbacterium sp. C7(2022)]MDE0545143.1 Ig-like domain-containing protein [Microbacterium sp. C7(2022)]